MLITSTINTLKPYLTASLAITIVALFIATMYFASGIALEWVAGMWGTLIMALLIMISQIAHTTRKIKN